MYQHDSSSGQAYRGAPKRVLIVDDSRVMRKWLISVLSTDPRLTIVGEASDAVQARDFIKSQPADVLTLDIEMPGMSGLEFLTRLMRARPMPVVMLSSLTTEGSDAAIQALSRGAIDCMLKPTTGIDEAMRVDICERVFQAACTSPSSFTKPKENSPNYSAANTIHRPPGGLRCRRGSAVLIGASTGGVAALETVLPDLDADGPPVFIVQHMPGNFLKSFVERLNRQLPQHVSLAREGITYMRGDVVVAPGDGMHTEVWRGADGWQCKFVANDPPALHCPSVDSLFHSAVSHAKNISAAILTGLGKDGAEGLLQLSQAGAKTFGQDEQSSVVYGMPRVAFNIGAVQNQLPVENIGRSLNDSFKRSVGAAARGRTA